MNIPITQFRDTDDQKHGEQQPAAEIDSVPENGVPVFVPCGCVAERKHDYRWNSRKYHRFGIMYQSWYYFNRVRRVSKGSNVCFLAYATGFVNAMLTIAVLTTAAHGVEYQ